MEQCSLPSDLSSRISIKEIPVAHEGLACGLDAILLCIIRLRMLNSNRSGFIQLHALSSQGSSQGLLQSVSSLQVSVAMPYYSIVMVSIGSSSGF